MGVLMNRKLSSKSITGIAKIICMGLCILFFALAANALNNAKNLMDDTLYLTCEETPLTGAEAYALQAAEARNKNAERSFTLWGSKITTVRSEYGIADSVPVIMVSGRTDLLFPEAPVLDYDMRSLCLVGEETARRLFGGTDVVGASLFTGGREYTIAGVLCTTGNAVVYETAYETDTGIDQMTLSCRSFGGKAFARFGYAESLPVAAKPLDYETMLWLFEIALLSIPLLFLIALFRAGKRRTTGPRAERLAWGAMTAAGCCAFVLAAAHQVDFPVDMIPPAWSDFDFFKELARIKTDNLMRLLRQPAVPPNYALFLSFVKTALFTGLSAVMYGISVFARGRIPRDIRANGKQRFTRRDEQKRGTL
jgi:hypothetical protein